MPASVNTETIVGLQNKATLMRIDSVRATTAAGSGHPTTCASAAEIMSALFFSVMRYDPKDPANPANDNFVLSKGHAAPVLYAAWAEAGYLERNDLLQLRKIDSDLEGHPPTTLPFVDVATGSLGQGLPVGVGMALAARLDGTGQRTFVLLGDGETAEGSVWEAASMAAHYKLDNLIATVDVNRLGQSGPTMLEHDMAAHASRWEAFGWKALVVDGHDLDALLAAYETAVTSTGRPTVVLAKTLKGKGIPFAEDKEGWHGKPFSGEQEQQAVRALESQLQSCDWEWKPNLPSGPQPSAAASAPSLPAPPYKVGGKEIATRRAFGDALAAFGKVDERIVAFDADVKNSTYTQELEDVSRKRLFQSYIAEQAMVGAAMGTACRGKIPFAATFACFLTRAADFIRMAAISRTNVKLVGTHAGISIGEDGPSQMGLEDLAMTAAQPDFIVLYPSDATSAWRAIELAAKTDKPFYVRTSRPNTAVIYGPDERFAVGEAKVVKSSARDQVTVVAGGVTLFEAIKAAEDLEREGIGVRVIDLFSVAPIDRKTLADAAKATNGRIVTVEDHYAHGGLGDAVLSALADVPGIVLKKLAVRAIAHSGHPEELFEKYGISSSHVRNAVKDLIA